ncbi:hypothetical protein [Yeosuana marina]|uniref:hypothetical protein n=2 Tax=Yeosuana marina TaxID=1565536 RepID=UPI0030ED8782|tara:strand:+ start:785 stop:1198 length:414 start_codon:yes stop_codon:yes gene_type:complete
MYFENSNYFKELEHKKLEFTFGNFYLCNHFFISEINEGVHFDWEKIKIVMPKIIDYYGDNSQLGYISNRVHSYSMDPYSWQKVDQKYGVIVAGAIVYYNDLMYKNATLEKLFSKKSLKRCINLDEAIYWMQTINEFS